MHCIKITKEMSLQDLKLYCINSGVLAISFTEVEMLLKVLLLSTTIIYTIQKIYINNNNEGN
jgi:hypothetical protein